MIKKIAISLVLFASVISGKADVFEDYINTYSPLAIEAQREFGIPASITLAQGLLESGAGRSVLAMEGNNHFGIKCHKDWDGERMIKADDRPDDCFRVYESVEESFRDHSLFLKKSRYAPLFKLEITDYQGWARGLKRCGYATSPTYADKLISIIERYGLNAFDIPQDERIDENVVYIHRVLSSTHPIRKNHGLHYVVAFPGDTYGDIAKEFGIKTSDLQDYNDAKNSKTIREWEEVYLQPKNDSAPEGVTKVTIGEGETMRSVSQSYGVKLSVVKKLNKRAKDRKGTVLKLH